MSATYSHNLLDVASEDKRNEEVKEMDIADEVDIQAVCQVPVQLF